MCPTAAQETGALVALDIGPIGGLLAGRYPAGFEDACAQFAGDGARRCRSRGTFVFLETMTDLYDESRHPGRKGNVTCRCLPR